MENNMWDCSCGFEKKERCEGRCEERREERREERCEPCKPKQEKCQSDCCMQERCMQDDCRSSRPVSFNNCNFLYNVSLVQFVVRDRERFMNVMRDMDRHMKKHHAEWFSGVQVYRTSQNMFVIVVRFFDKPGCRNAMPGMLQFINDCFIRNFGRTVRIRQILNGREAERIFC